MSCRSVRTASTLGHLTSGSCSRGRPSDLLKVPTLIAVAVVLFHFQTELHETVEWESVSRLRNSSSFHCYCSWFWNALTKLSQGGNQLWPDHFTTSFPGSPLSTKRPWVRGWPFHCYKKEGRGIFLFRIKPVKNLFRCIFIAGYGFSCLVCPCQEWKLAQWKDERNNNFEIMDEALWQITPFPTPDKVTTQRKKELLEWINQVCKLTRSSSPDPFITIIFVLHFSLVGCCSKWYACYTFVSSLLNRRCYAGWTSLDRADEPEIA